MIEEVLETIYSCGKCKTKPVFLILPNGLQNQAYERGSHEGAHFRPRCEVGALVVRFSQIEGYRCLSLMRASGVVEVPVCLGVVGIAGVLPGGDFVDESLFVWDAAVEALGR